jgi:DNA-binding LacI/PurR family transcriptional regulator
VAQRGGERVTLQTLADALGVSRTTVSNAFNRPDQLNPALRKRVLALAGELGYAGPDPAGRALRSGRAGAIGVMFTEGLSYAFDDPAAVATLGGLAAEAERAATSLVLLPASDSSIGGPTAEAVHAALVDGIFMYALPAHQPGVVAAVERHVPIVVADTPRLPGVPFVGVDDRSGARAAAAHLAELGHRHVGVIAFRLCADDHEGFVDGERRRRADYKVTYDRLEGYGEGLADAGIDSAAAPVYEVYPNARKRGAAAARVLLGLDPRPTALLAMSDELALGAIDVAAELGLTIPGDLSLIGFDDAPAAALATPALTSVGQPLVEKGRAAGRMLLEALAGGSPADVILPTELVVRSSTAAPPTP